MDTQEVVSYRATVGDSVGHSRRHFPTFAGPTGIAFGPDGAMLVWSQFDRVLTINRDRAEDLSKMVRVHTGPRREDPIAMGRALFHSSEDGGIAADGRACASCHPDGRDDGLVWRTPDGPRQTPMLGGRARDTAPYGWTRKDPDLHAYIEGTVERLRGHGLEARHYDALAAYVASLKAPAPPAPIDAVPLLARGATLFRSSEVGCARCHVPERGFTDGAQHDIRSAAPTDNQPAFETPSLRFVGATAPYFHDGRFDSLEDLFALTDGTMGRTRQLSSEDRAALAAYVRSL
jgi:mono/diheme cytochrome c family protein